MLLLSSRFLHSAVAISFDEEGIGTPNNLHSIGCSWLLVDGVFAANSTTNQSRTTRPTDHTRAPDTTNDRYRSNSNRDPNSNFCSAHSNRGTGYHPYRDTQPNAAPA